MSWRLWSKMRFKRPRVAAAHVVEVDLRDLLAGDVAQARAGPAGRPRATAAGTTRAAPSRAGARGAAGRSGALGEGEARAVQPEAGVEQGQVEHLAVEGDHPLEAREVVGEGVEQRRLLVVVAHEVLADAEAVAVHVAECRSGRPPCPRRRRGRSSRCRGRRPSAGRSARGPPRRSGSRPVSGRTEWKRRERHVAVAGLEVDVVLHQEELAPLVLDPHALDQLFEGHAAGPRLPRSRRVERDVVDVGRGPRVAAGLRRRPDPTRPVSQRGHRDEALQSLAQRDAVLGLGAEQRASRAGRATRGPAGARGERPPCGGAAAACREGLPGTWERCPRLSSRSRRLRRRGLGQRRGRSGTGTPIPRIVSSSASATSLPRLPTSPTGPTQDGQPSRHGQARDQRAALGQQPVVQAVERLGQADARPGSCRR